MEKGNYDLTSQDLQINIANAKLLQQKKNRRRNEDAFRVTSDVLRKIKEDPLMKYFQENFTSEDTKEIQEILNTIENKVNDGFEDTS